MARWLKAEDIPMIQRAPHIKRYQAQLREALSNPALTGEQRAEVRAKLRSLGKPPIYGASPVSEPEAPTSVSPSTEVAEPVTAVPPAQTLEDLLVLTKDELLALAAEEGVELTSKSRSTKNAIAQAILLKRAET